MLVHSSSNFQDSTEIDKVMTAELKKIEPGREIKH